MAELDGDGLMHQLAQKQLAYQSPHVLENASAGQAQELVVLIAEKELDSALARAILERILDEILQKRIWRAIVCAEIEHQQSD